MKGDMEMTTREMTTRKTIAVSLAVILMGAMAPCAFAQDMDEEDMEVDEVSALITPQSTLEIGGAGVFGESRFFGMYSGLDANGGYAIGNANVVQRDEETGTWLRLSGTDLGIDSRSARFEHERQGDWNYYVDFSQISKQNPYEYNTGLTGIGSDNQAVAGTALRQVDLSTDRYRVKAGGGKTFLDKFDVKVSFRHEIKDGERAFGAGGFGGGGINFLAEPIDYVTDEVDAVFSYTGEKLQFSGAYLGSFFSNGDEVLTSDSTAITQVALPLNNQAHKVSLSGAYAFTPTTRANGTASYSLELQDENFFTSPTFAGNNRTSLDGEVASTLLQASLSSRPLEKLSLLAKVRYEDRDDNTPVSQFITTSATRSGNNVPFSRTTTTADLEASYMMPADFRLTAAGQWEMWDRSIATPAHASFREDTQEWTARAELSRALTGTLAGKLGYTHSERIGSDYQGLATAGVIDPILWADRVRNKFLVTMDWAPFRDFSLQGQFQSSFDTYDGRVLGPRKGTSRLISFDATKRLGRYWDLTGWISHSKIFQSQATNGDGLNASGGAINNQNWQADLEHINNAIGLDLRGAPTEELKVGTNVEYSNYQTQHGMYVYDGTAIIPLDDIYYRQWNLEACADYALSANSSIKFNYVFAHMTTNDWTFTGWTYTDGTTVKIPESEATHFIGLTYNMGW